MKENEENIGLINKKAFEDQWACLVSEAWSVLTFCQLKFRALLLISLSLSLLVIEFSWSTLAVEGNVTRFGIHKCNFDICIYSRKEKIFLYYFSIIFLFIELGEAHV